MFMDVGVLYFLLFDIDVEDYEDNGLGDEYEDMVQEEDEDEDDDWCEDWVIEVWWCDGFIGFSYVQVIICWIFLS